MADVAVSSPGDEAAEKDTRMQTWAVADGEDGSVAMMTDRTSGDVPDIAPPRVESEEEAKEAAEKEQEIANVKTEPSYSIFTGSERITIVVLTSLAALFSPLTANIYYPALDTLAKDMNVSVSLISLSITTYLIFQGLAPSFIGSLSDETGRRPSYIVCFVIYICACLGLALQNSYAALMVLRCLQSSGSSGTVALANAVVADIATSSERGMYIGYVSMGALLGPAIGPILGGIINEFAGWRWIFWFLTIFGGVVLCTLLVLLPETCRKIVGNGALPAQRWNLSLLNWLARRQARKQGIAANDSTRSNFKARPNPINTIYVIADKESGIVLLYAGVIFAGYYMLLTSFTSEFAKNYKFNSLQVGLCYIPSGMGSFTAAVVTGRTVDWNFRRLAKSIGMELHSSKQPDLTHFPIEKARLQVLLPIAISASAFTVAYGWSMEARTSLAAPLIFNFCVSFCVSSTFQGTSTLVVDLNQDRPGTATAAMNLVRCWLGAGATAMAIPMINRMGIGWVSVFIAGVWLALSPIILLIIRYGPGWRAEKRQKLDRSRLERERLERERAGGEAGGGGP